MNSDNHDSQNFTREDIARLTIDPALWELIPASLIQEDTLLVVGSQPNELHVITYPRPTDAHKELQEKLEFIFQQKFKFSFAPKESLELIINRQIRIGNATIQNCDVKFKFQCPQEWLRMTPKNDEKIRFCSTCQQNVHLCETAEQAESLGRNGLCVALLGSSEAWVDMIGLIDFE